MQLEFLYSKIHRATVTDANLNYVGSITIDETLLKAANIREWQKVEILDVNNGERFQTYVIKGKADSGQICLNGAAARKVQPGDKVIIVTGGASGIGKTEVARLLHQKLAADEPMIKINFGNYSAQDALNSLIGSPRGYIGSNKGELPDKLMRSRSKVILIDEFEKASKAVYNFFLQLLEEGKFTDSLGREYDLEKYIIIFTSNMPKERIGEFLPPELRSRFSYKCAFWPLSTQEKEQYVAFKSEHYLEKIKHECPGLDSTLQASDIIDIDVSRYSNMRDINSEIMRQITDALYAQIVK